jgi:hypothetical protein
LLFRLLSLDISFSLETFVVLNAFFARVFVRRGRIEFIEATNSSIDVFFYEL